MNRILVFALLAVSVQGFPQGYGSGNNNDVGNLETPDCITKLRDVNEIVNKEEFKKVCNPFTEQVCQTLSRKDCQTVEDQECNEILRDECNIELRENCYDDFRDVPQPYTEDECKDAYVTVCEKAWIEQGYNDKVWADDPSTCKELKETKCIPVQKTRNVPEKYTKCDKVPFQNCRKVPEQKCVLVKKEKCQDIPYQDCKDVTTEKCVDKHIQVPQQVTKQVSVRVCKNEQGQFPAEAEFNSGAQVIAARQPGVVIRTGAGDVEGAEEAEVAEVAEAPAPGNNEQDPDRIVFG